MNLEASLEESRAPSIGHPYRAERADRIHLDRKRPAVGVAQIEHSDSLVDAHQASRLTVGKYVEQSSIRDVGTDFYSEALSRRGVGRLECGASGRSVLLAVRSWRKANSIATIRDGHVGRKRDQERNDCGHHTDRDCSHRH